jgi:hypothetical protein
LVAEEEMSATYTEMRVRSHVVGIERLERLRWRVSVDGRRLFTFCSEARARDAGRLEARRLDFAASEAVRRRVPPAPPAP